jgi:signal transduction histidine kinase
MANRAMPATGPAPPVATGRNVNRVGAGAGRGREEQGAMNVSATAGVPPGTGSTRRWVVDAAIALVVAALQVAGSYGAAHHYHGGTAPSPLEYAMVTVAGLALVARRRFPVGVLTVTGALSVGYWALAHVPSPIFLSDIVALVTVVMARKRVAAVIAVVVYYLGYQWLPVLTGVRAAPSPLAAVLAAAGLVVLLGAAELLRVRRQRAAAIARSRQDQARRQASEERLRIARDLHDVVAHNISVINVQANTALHLIDRQPEQAVIALSTIHEVSKQALAELRSVLGVLREDGAGAPRAPSPGLSRLDDLSDSAAAAGLTVRVEREGTQRQLPAEVDVAAYRIVQEALTNSARHSAGSTATVCVRYSDDDVVVQVDDEGAGGRPAPRPAGDGSGGNGIAGMTERAHALGGSLQAGPRPGGGFRVRARLPLAAGGHRPGAGQAERGGREERSAGAGIAEPGGRR